MPRSRARKLATLEAYYRVQFFLQARLRAVLTASSSEEATESAATFLGRRRFAALAYRICCQSEIPTSSVRSSELLKQRTELHRQYHRGLKGDAQYATNLTSMRQRIYVIESDMIDEELLRAEEPRCGVSRQQAKKSLAEFRKELLLLVSLAGTEEYFVFALPQCRGAGQSYIGKVRLPLPDLIDIDYTRLKATGFPKYPQHVVGPKADFARGLYACASDIKFLLLRCERSLVSLKRKAKKQFDKDIARLRKVPPLQTGRFLEGRLTPEQHSFMENVYHEFSIGNCPELCGQYSYAYVNMQRLILEQPVIAHKLMPKLVLAYGKDDKKARRYLLHLLSDCYVLAGDYAAARMVLGDLPNSFGEGPNPNAVLSLDLLVTGVPSAQALMIIGLETLTRWGDSRRDQIADHLESILKTRESEARESIFAKCGAILLPSDYFRISGSMLAERVLEYNATICGDAIENNDVQTGIKAPIRGYPFSHDKNITAFAMQVVRDAENAARVGAGLPKIGEGWISETELYYAIKDAYSDIEVIHHARPGWLGRQHLDIFIPSMGVAVEYQGEQHDRPVELFGGFKAFEKIQRLDARKLDLCGLNGVALVYVRSGYTLEEVKQMVVAAARTF